MKIIKNNSKNYLTFVQSGESTNEIIGIIFRQLGSGIEHSVSAIVFGSDCFVTTIEFDLDYNELKNASYTIRVIDDSGRTIYTSNAIVSNNDGQDNYIILDQNDFSSTIGNLPVQVIFDTFDNTFDNTFG